MPFVLAPASVPFSSISGVPAKPGCVEPSITVASVIVGSGESKEIVCTAGRGDVEANGVRAAVGVGFEDGLTQRTRAVVVSVNDNERGREVIVAHVAQAVAVGICLVGVGDKRTVIGCIVHAVVVVARVAHIAFGVFVIVGLVRVGGVRTVVARVRDAVRVRIGVVIGDG